MNRDITSVLTMLHHHDLCNYSCFHPVRDCHTRFEVGLLTEDILSHGEITTLVIMHMWSCSAYLSGQLFSPPRWSQRNFRLLHRGSGGCNTKVQPLSAAAPHCSWCSWRITQMPVMFSFHSGLFSSCDIIYLVSVSTHFTSIPCQNMNWPHVIVLHD